MARLAGKVGLITGGGTGVGRATAELFGAEGARVIINFSRSKSDADDTVKSLEAQGVEAVAIQADVSDEAQVEAMFANVEAKFGRLDILVNNAAVTQMVAYDDLRGLTSEIWDKIMSVNVKGAFFCSRDAIELMLKNGEGQIVNVSSIAGIAGLGSSIAYSASKAALINMTRGLAASHAPEIQVNAVAPGVIETRWIQGWEKYTDPHREKTPMKRHAQPEDIAMSIFGLIINPFVTGQTLVVDGGRTIGTT